MGGESALHLPAPQEFLGGIMSYRNPKNCGSDLVDAFVILIILVLFALTMWTVSN